MVIPTYRVRVKKVDGNLLHVTGRQVSGMEMENEIIQVPKSLLSTLPDLNSLVGQIISVQSTFTGACFAKVHALSVVPPQPEKG